MSQLWAISLNKFQKSVSVCLNVFHALLGHANAITVTLENHIEHKKHFFEMYYA